MAFSGKHSREPEVVRVGNHGIVVRKRTRTPFIALAIAAIAALCLLALLVGHGSANSESLAFADPARATFAGLSDVAGQEENELELPANRVDYASRISTKMQNAFMSGGCELVSLGIALESMGIPADLDRIADEFLVIDGHFATGYSGSPYTQGGGYPPGIAAAANGYLESLGETARAHDFTGESFDTLTSLLNKGYPVLTWTTMGFENPRFSGKFDNGVEWYDNEHCVVVYGIEGDRVLVSDPLSGFCEVDLERFADLHAQCGNMALAIF